VMFETLAERVFHALADDARELVGSRAGRHPADDRDWSRRIGLCICSQIGSRISGRSRNAPEPC
jgi:hypothetical protein